MCSHPCRELLGVPSLHEDRPRARKLADQAFPAADAGNDASARHTLHHVLAVPGHEVAVVDDVLFAFHKLRFSFVSGAACGGEEDKRKQTYVFANNGAETRQP